MVNNIQVLRAFAALAVVWRHMLMWFNTDPGFGLLYVGRVGVDIFFVISGFIMFHTTRDGTRTTGEFWLDRIVRIAPPYWIITLVICAMWVVGIPASDVRRIDANDVVLDLLFIPNLRADGDANPILNVGWTLIFEAFFYFLFGLTFFLKSQKKALAVLTALFAGLSLVPLAATHLPFVISRYMTPITLEFAAGGLLALMFRQPLKLSETVARLLGHVLLVVGIAGAFGSAWWMGQETAEPTALRTLLYGPPALLIVAGALLLEKAGVLWRSRTLLFLGAASYSIYLAHPLVLQYAWMSAERLVPEGGFVHNVVGGGIAFGAATLAGIVFHLWIETPVLKGLRALIHRGRHVTSISAKAGEVAPT